MLMVSDGWKIILTGALIILSLFLTENGGGGGLGSEAHGLGYSSKKVELSSFPQQPRIPPGVCHHVDFNLINYHENWINLKYKSVIFFQIFTSLTYKSHELIFAIFHSVQSKSVDIQQLPALDQRSSFADASAASGSQPPAVQPLPYGGRRRRYKTKYIERRNGGRDKVRYEYKYRGRDVVYYY